MTGIPRYYEKWFKENHPDKYLRYLSEVKGPMMLKAQEREKRKRPHFHACLFGWRPHDAVYKYTSDRGDKVFEST